MATQEKLPESRHVAFILVPDYSLIAFAAALEPLRLANQISERKIYNWSCHTLHGAPVAASNGLATQPDGAIDRVGKVDLVVVCAGLNVERQVHPRALLSRLRYLASHGATMGAICTGSYLLARAGLLDNHRCTIHWESLRGFREEFPGIEATSELFEIDKRIMTSAGGTASLDMMLHYVATQCGADLASSIADMMLHHHIRSSDDAQRPDLRVRLGVSHPKLVAAIALMEADLEAPLSCRDLAEAVNLSPRQLERLFAKHLATTPMRYYLRLRLFQARRLLQQTSLSVLRIGLGCGFSSASHFSKCYRDIFGKSPRQERSQ